MLDSRKDKLALRTAKVKIMTAGLVFGVIFVIFSGYLAKQYIGKPEEQRLSNLKQIVELGRNSIEPILVKYRSKQISKAQALEQVRNLVRRMVYEDELGKNYVFMSSYDGTMLVQPFEPQREMTNMWNLKDAYGVYIIRELIKTAESKNGSGYVSYYYKRPNQSKPEEKISFVIGIPEINCYIGTGKYMTDIRKAERTYIISIASLTFLLIALLAILVLSSMREVQRQNLMLQQENEALKQAEEALRESEQKYRSLVESTEDSIYLVDRDSTYLFVNKHHMSRLGLQPNEFLGLAYGELHSDEDTQEFTAIVEKVFEIGRPLQQDHRSRKDNRHFLRTFSPVKELDGKTQAITVVSKDITERMKTEEALRKSEEKLARSNKMEAMGLMAGGIAHDLNNILSGIVSYPELLLMDLPEDSPLRKPIKTIQESGMRAADVVEDLLTVARGVATGKEVLNLNTLIAEYLSSAEHQKLEKTRSFVDSKTEFDSDLLNMSGSPTHIKKVLMNLVTNASEAIEGSGTVTISTENRYLDEPLKGYEDVRTGEYVMLTVSDNGSGISPKDLDRIFEPFYTKKVMGRSGTGLGLAVVWNSMQDHNGYINVNTSEKGTAFELYFPVTREEVAAEGEEVPLEDCLGHGEKILVVDDEERQREIASGILTRLGYTADAVSSGEEAIEYVKEQPVDLIVLDMVMPKGINGRKTYEEIIKIRPKQKAIIASGYAKTKEVDIAQELGAGKYIKKPYTLAKVGVSVKEELEK